MAWMWGATEHDMTVGMHMHYHNPPPVFAPPVPFYPHPAIGMIRDKLCGNVKVDGRKAAKTGAKTKVLIPPHMPWIGPLTTGLPKENTGIQQAWMGAGIGAHPFGGVGFVVFEGKPAVGFLSNCMGCWSVAPGLDMMLPFIGLDFVMVPTHGPTVFYGPAPLALDLFVFLLAMLRNAMDFILSKVPDGFWKDTLSDAFDSIEKGAEVTCDAIEQGVPVGQALTMGAQAAAYTFVDRSVTRATNALGSFADQHAPPGSWAGRALDFGLEHGLGMDREGAQQALHDGIMGRVAGEGSWLGQGAQNIENMNSRYSEADPANNPIGFVTDPLEHIAQTANETAVQNQQAHHEHTRQADEAHQRASDAQARMNDPNASHEDRAQARRDFQRAQHEEHEHREGANAASEQATSNMRNLGRDTLREEGRQVLNQGREGAQQAVMEGAGVDPDSAAGRALQRGMDRGFDAADRRLGNNQFNNPDAWRDRGDGRAPHGGGGGGRQGFGYQGGDEQHGGGDQQRGPQGRGGGGQHADGGGGRPPSQRDNEAPHDPGPHPQPLSPHQQEQQSQAGQQHRDNADRAAEEHDQATGRDQQAHQQAAQSRDEQEAERLRTNLRQSAENDRRQAEQARRGQEDARSRVERYDQEHAGLQQQRANARSDADRQRIDEDIAINRDLHRQSQVHSEMADIEARHLDQRARQSESLSNDHNYVHSGADHFPHQPVQEGMQDADRQRHQQLMNESSQLGGRLSSRDNYRRRR